MLAETEENAPTAVRTIRLRWQDVIVVCGKCLKRHDEGKAVRRALKAEVKAYTGDGAKVRKTRVVRTGCLGICPRGAVVVASAPLLAAGEVMLVRDADEVAEGLSRLRGLNGRRI